MNQSAINTYLRVGVESSAAGADPHHLIGMLYKGAIESIDRAIISIKIKDNHSKIKALGQTFNIIHDGLSGSLNRKVPGKMVQDLSYLYEYMLSLVLKANIDNDLKVLEELKDLIRVLQSAWESIGRNQTSKEYHE